MLAGIRDFVAVDEETAAAEHFVRGIGNQLDRESPAVRAVLRRKHRVTALRNRPDVGIVLIVGIVHPIAVAGIAGRLESRAVRRDQVSA